ncbi:Type 1 glutamine amidotransferase-like domain-containing protein [Paenibacillus allorhizosphaerae]|uniref:IS1595 family transposase ISBci1 n=1 Tax=Paenibacillus allorhizosphaerae TaxID=2849866 RepID=A0ABM8VAC6_9BACL|nr:Type 1 glutamine amidotransferase-like domain-containing protein [Paenibacillus allorhizosphaerae]CAG7615981.1 IS1595 family transposase ISBci1 [Paenibacillus allorhizosphaerae]
MRKILLTSAGFATSNITEAFLDLVDRSPNELTAVIMTTAAVQLKSHARPSLKAKQALDSMGFRKVEFIDIEFEDADKLNKYDVICLSGGNPFHLLHHLRRSGADQIIESLSKNGVVLVGISAGTVVLGPDIRIVDYFTPHLNHVGMHDLTALRLHEPITFPHYGRHDKFPHDETIEARIQQFESTHQCEILRITDHEALYINGETMTKISHD